LILDESDIEAIAKRR